MAYDRYSRSDRDHRWLDQPRGEYGYSDDFGRSSARDYAAAGEMDRGRDRDRYRGYDGSRPGMYGDDQGGREFGRSSRAAPYRGAYWSDGHRMLDDRNDRDGQGDDYRYRERGNDYRYRDRDFFSRAGDEVRSWFGDDEAERRRALDARYDNRANDDHYRGWRSRQIADLDRDYDEYRREHATRFENEFASWRSDRNTQRGSLARVDEHMEVVGSDGEHVGTVDKVRGDRIILTKNDTDAGGHHHSIPSRWIDSVDDKVTIRKTAQEAQSAWRDEERSGALFGEQGERSGPHYLNRSFSGTY
jgi:hypothetical protein